MDLRHSRQPRVYQINAVLVAVLAVAFYLFFDAAKHVPALATINPFVNDPYDAIGSFGIQAAAIFAGLSLVRAFWPLLAGEPSEERRVALARTQVAALLAVLITLVGDIVALARHTSLWLGTGAGYALCGLVAGLLVLTAVVARVVCRSPHLEGRIASATPSALPRVWRRWSPALVMSLVALVALALYPEAFRDSGLHGAILTVLAGILLLFAPMRWLTLALVPGRAAVGDDTHSIFGWLTGNAPRVGLVLLFGLIMGALVYIAEAHAEGTPHDATKRITVLLVFVGLEASGILIGYFCLGGTLALFLPVLPAGRRAARTIPTIPTTSTPATVRERI